MFPCPLVAAQEGTELFKGQNYRQAGARYSKALTHAAKMFDLNAEEQKEVHAVQLSLYLNLAQCYLKLQSWDQVRAHGRQRGGWPSCSFARLAAGDLASAWERSGECCLASLYVPKTLGLFRVSVGLLAVEVGWPLARWNKSAQEYRTHRRKMKKRATANRE